MLIKYRYSDPTEEEKFVYRDLELFLKDHPLYRSFLSEGRELHESKITLEVLDYPFVEVVTVSQE